MSFNSSSKITYTDMNGIILPHSSRTLFESEINSKIKKAKSHIDRLSNAQSYRNTHSGKRFRARQISLRSQIDSSYKRLTLLLSAKEIIECKSYASRYITEALVVYDVIKYRSTLVSRVNGICLEMSCFCKDDKPKFERLAEKLTKEINELTTDKKEKDKLYKYANRIMRVGEFLKNYSEKILKYCNF